MHQFRSICITRSLLKETHLEALQSPRRSLEIPMWKVCSADVQGEQVMFDKQTYSYMRT